MKDPEDEGCGLGRTGCGGREFRPDPARELRDIGAEATLRRRDVLEVGAGDGRLTLAIAALAERVLAVDADPGAIEAARLAARRAGIRNVSFRVAPAQDLGLGRRRFDVAVFSWSL
ncbi:MAG: class I SAM-dependent methyltransferase [Chloroflexota bacterium]|nr:class I SAM-dependent methyltransferase [Chloroflexota bacterium]